MSLLKKAKKDYHQNLDEKNVIDHQKFWKTVKPLLSGKSVFREKKNLTDNEKTLTSESETSESLNNFFSNIVKKLEIPKFDSNDSVTENIQDPVFKTILKYKNHSSVLEIQKHSKNKIFYFEGLKVGEIEKKFLSQIKRKLHKKPIFPLELLRRILIYLRNFYVRA